MGTSPGDERATLELFLDRQRDEVAQLLDGLCEDEARSRLVPSLTTPLGLVMHAVFVERVWFHSRVSGVSRAEVGLPDVVNESFDLKPADTIDGVRRCFGQACERSRAIAATHRLDEEFEWHQSSVSLRYIYAHLIAEHARHAGHGDILAEQIQAQRQN